ncbi:hematopoietically-expressed homeobox protein HHEX-like [Neocloeon triangulifer]|uniref:hematopoietically-expressed homeobox protein HHEX-like n=1 Tax=Neocloeon triangulifer TaxID=2078957 RepID=UPI00286EDAE8|nr:hematopoietically-expressed homeobox protein HHEX-like [Neocloeon triangulifer]
MSFYSDQTHLHHHSLRPSFLVDDILKKEQSFPTALPFRPLPAYPPPWLWNQQTPFTTYVPPYRGFLQPQWFHLRPNKRKGGQVRFSSQQSALLERKFKEQQYLSPEQRRQLAETLSLTERQIKTWFQNRRAKWRRSRDGAHEYDGSSDAESNGNTNEEALPEEDNKTVDKLETASHE